MNLTAAVTADRPPFRGLDVLLARLARGHIAGIELRPLSVARSDDGSVLVIDCAVPGGQSELDRHRAALAVAVDPVAMGCRPDTRVQLNLVTDVDPDAHTAGGADHSSSRQLRRPHCNAPRLLF